jgi:hypothetical protein
MTWIVLAGFVGGVTMGFAVGFVLRNRLTSRWARRAVEMAQINKELMDRVDVLEAERQSEG